MQTVQEWKNKQKVQTKTSNKVQSVSEWKSNPTVSSDSRVQSVSEWKKSQPVKAQVPELITPVKTKLFENVSNKIASNIIANQPKVTKPQTPNILGMINSGQSLTAYKPGVSTPSTDISTGGYGNRFVAPIEDIPAVMRPARAIYDLFKETSSDLQNRFQSLSDSVYENKPLVDKTSKAGSVLLGMLNSAFLPLTAYLKGAEEIPVIGGAAKVINKIFEKAGEVGVEGGDMVVDELPVSQSTKDSIRPLITEITAFLSQIALGKVSHTIVRPRLDILNKELGKRVLEDPKFLENRTKEKPLQKPDIMSVKEWKDAGKPQTPVESGKIGQTPVESGKIGQTPVESGKIGQTPVVKTIEPLDQLPSRVYERLKAEHPDMLKEDVTYEKSTRKAGIEKAVKLVETNKQDAFNTAMGAKEGVLEVDSVYANITLAEKALSEGNTKLYSQLVKNRTLAQTRRGQAIEAEKASVTDNSTSRYVREVISERLNKLGNNYLSDISTTLKKGSKKEYAGKIIDNGVAKLEKQIKAKKLDVKTAMSLLDKLACI